MADADSTHSSLQSEESRMGSTGPLGSWESELASVQHCLKFVMTLKEEFVCPVCRGVVLNPQQNSCGHIFCFHCLHKLLESSSASRPVCPADGAEISAAEVFQDNCCKREISNLEVYCTNAPACTCVVTLHHLQEHLSSCQYEQLQCCNPGCRVALQRRYLQEHLTVTCPHRMEPCRYCRQPQPLSLIQEHVQTSCPEVEVDCPNSCSRRLPRHKLAEHQDSCPEVPVNCSYKRFGCSAQDKRGKVKLHEQAAVGHHVLLLLGSTAHLEHQVEALQEEASLRQQEVGTDSLVLAGRQQDVGSLLQESNSHERAISTIQRTLSRQEDVVSAIQLEAQQVSQVRGPGLGELEQLRENLHAVSLDMTTTEAVKEHLGTMQENLKHQLGLLEFHGTQLTRNKQHLRELEATSYNGTLIWKIEDFRNRREAEVRGQLPCLSSVPFYSGRCGYKMAAKVYLNGDKEGRGAHLSFYVVLMPADFDVLLPWPFRRTITLSVLDQSGAGNHHSLRLRPDMTSKSFPRPAAESATNETAGFPCFIPLHKLEAPQNAVYVDDDTLFVKVKVDMAGLEQL